MEGVWAYHVINSNQSFKSSDCASKIFQKCFKMEKFSLSQKKCQAIVTNVFAPHAQKLLETDLNGCNYVSVYTDASNHGNIKLFPVFVRYFIPTEGINVKMLDLTEAPGENSTIISGLIESAASKYDLKQKIVGFCGDNAKVNFGGETLAGWKYSNITKTTEKNTNKWQRSSSMFYACQVHRLQWKGFLPT